jgi:hypothetical protein
LWDFVSAKSQPPQIFSLLYKGAVNVSYNRALSAIFLIKQEIVIEIEKFISDGEMYDKNKLENLFKYFSD